MALDSMLMGANSSEPSRKNRFLCIVCAFCAGFALVFVATSNSGANKSDNLALNAIGLRSTRLGGSPQFSKSQAVPNIISSIGSNPMERLAIEAIKATNQCRDISVRAVEDAEAPKAEETKEVVETKGATPYKDTRGPRPTREEWERRATWEEVTAAVEYKAKTMAGVTLPLGYFDPLGFASDCNEGRLMFYREVEIKHGRVCMLATLGILVAEQFHPLFGGNIDVPAYIAFQQTPLQTFWVAVLAALAIPEGFSIARFGEQYFEMKLDDRVPGDLGFDPLGLKPTDPSEMKEMQTKEINNGRLAMIAAAGMIAQELATGQKIFH